MGLSLNFRSMCGLSCAGFLLALETRLIQKIHLSYDLTCKQRMPSSFPPWHTGESRVVYLPNRLNVELRTHPGPDQAVL